jgi:two-component system, cell cycle response regulator DivK
MREQGPVLIIDDDPRNIFALSAVLKAKGFTVRSVSSAQEGIAHLHQDKNIRVVLMDMMMPGMDGYEALSEIRRHPKFDGIQLIAVTAQAMVGDREKCLEAGADEYVSKPIDIDLLLKFIHQYK